MGGRQGKAGVNGGYCQASEGADVTFWKPLNSVPSLSATTMPANCVPGSPEMFLSSLQEAVSQSRMLARWQVGRKLKLSKL